MNELVWKGYHGCFVVGVSWGVRLRRLCTGGDRAEIGSILRPAVCLVDTDA